MNAVAFISCSKSSLPQAKMEMAKTVLIANRTMFSSVLSHVDDVQLCAETLRGKQEQIVTWWLCWKLAEVFTIV